VKSNTQHIQTQGLITRSYDNHYALQQIEDGHNALLTRQPFTSASEPGISKSGKTLPRIITVRLSGMFPIGIPAC
jgi:hypothetical protein